MNEIIDFVSRNWALFGGAGIILAPNIWALLRGGVSKLKTTFSVKKGNGAVSTIESSGIIMKDLECLQWLADRGVESANDELVTELENVNQKLYRIHRDMYKSTLSAKSN